MKTFTCTVCGVLFDSPTKGNAIYCPSCRKKMRAYRTAVCKQQKIGCGSGGNQQGENNHEWKGGKRTYSKINNLKYCEVCGNTVNLHTHHKDLDRNNNDPSNLQKLCASCHAKIHNFGSHFSQAEVKPTQNEELGKKISCFQ